MERNSAATHPALRLLLALDRSFEPLAAVALCSFLAHNRFERVVVVTPNGTHLSDLLTIAGQFQTRLDQIHIPADGACEALEPSVKGYFYCIEAFEAVCHGALAHDHGRYLYVDADTLCIRDLTELSHLPLSETRPLAACSHGRPMVDRQLVLELDSPYHYFNAGVLLFDSWQLAAHISSNRVVSYFQENRAICRFREQCALNALLRGKVRFLPNQYNYLSWMRPRVAGGAWHDLSANPMAYCLAYVREELAIAHLSAGAIPSRLAPERLESVDTYWLNLDSILKANIHQEGLQPPRFQDYMQTILQNAETPVARPAD